MKEYLGDSVYAEFDGYNVVLTTENGLPTDPNNRIALEPEAIVALMAFKTRIDAYVRKALALERQAADAAKENP